MDGAVQCASDYNIMQDQRTNSQHSGVRHSGEKYSGVKQSAIASEYTTGLSLKNYSFSILQLQLTASLNLLHLSSWDISTFTLFWS